MILESNSVHLTAQGKGGIGKSVCAATLFQYLKSIDLNPQGYDTDPVNRTLQSYSDLDVKRVETMKGDDINKGMFDSMIEAILEDDKRPALIDNGTSNYIALMSYVKSSEIVELLVDSGRTVYIHVVVAAGQALVPTLQGLDEILTAFKGTKGLKIVIWENRVWGPVEAEGAKLSEMSLVKRNRASITGIVCIDEMEKETFGRDFSNMLEKSMTYDQVLEGENSVLVKHRIKKLRDALYSNISSVLGGAEADAKAKA